MKPTDAKLVQLIKSLTFFYFEVENKKKYIILFELQKSLNIQFNMKSHL